MDAFFYLVNVVVHIFSILNKNCRMGDFSLICLLFFLGSGILGFILGRLFKSDNKAELEAALAQSRRDKSALNDIVKDYNNLKNECAELLSKKDDEIGKLQRLNTTLSRPQSNMISSSTEKSKWKSKTEALENEVDKLKLQLKDNSKEAPKQKSKWKDKAAVLEQQVSDLTRALESRLEKSSLDKSKLKEKIESLQSEMSFLQTELAKTKEGPSDKAYNALIADLKKAEEKIKKQDVLIMEAKRESFKGSDNERKGVSKISEKKIKALTKKIKKYKLKLKSLKKQFKNSLNQKEAIETIDIEKLSRLIESGALLKKKVHHSVKNKSE